jgi:hypothetical protein
MKHKGKFPEKISQVKGEPKCTVWSKDESRRGSKPSSAVSLSDSAQYQQSHVRNLVQGAPENIS